jgi:hypothetical protein
MRRIIGLALVGLLMGGCAVYADPYPYAYPGPPAPGVYVAPPPVVIAPAYPYYWGWGHRWRGGHRRG